MKQNAAIWYDYKVTKFLKVSLPNFITMILGVSRRHIECNLDDFQNLVLHVLCM